MGKWQNLTAKQKAEVIRFAIQNGVSDINSIRDTYNLYSNGDNLTHKKSGKEQGESQGLNSSWLPDFAYNPDNGRRPLQSILQDAAIQRTIQQKALQRQAEMEAEREAQRKATHEIYNGMPNPGAGYVSGTDPLLQAIVDMTPAGDAEMATEAASELRNGNLKEAGLLGAALLLPNIFNKGIKEWRTARALKNNERGLVYTTRNNLTKYNPNLNEETIQALQQAERDYSKGLFTLEHQSELDPIFELGLHTPTGKAAYPEGVEIWYRGLSRSKGKQVGITPEEFEEMWDKSVAAGKYSNLFFGDLNTASSYISGHTNPLEYARITGRNFPKGDDSKLLQLVFPKGRALEIDVNGAGWANLQRLPFGKLSTKEEKQLKNMSTAYDNEIKKQKLLQQRLDNYYRKHPEKMQEISQAKWLQELQNKIYKSYGKVSKAHRDLMPLYKKKYPFARTSDVSAYLIDSNLNGITLLNIQDNGPKITAWGQLGNVSIIKPVPGNYGKSAIASDFKFDLNDPSIWALGGNLKSTGGPLYPFSFEKNPYLKTPIVRYDEGGFIRDWDSTLTGKLINYVENSDSIGWVPQDRTWEHPTLPGYDKNQIGMGVDKNETKGYAEHIKYRQNGTPYLTEKDERVLRHAAIEKANTSANARYKFAQQAVNRPEGTISKVKDAAVVSAIYNLGATYVANGLFEDKDFMLKLFDGTDQEVVDRINQEYKKKKRNERIAKTNQFLFKK